MYKKNFIDANIFIDSNDKNRKSYAVHILLLFQIEMLKNRVD